MAVYTPADALNWAKIMVKKMPLDDVQVRIADQIASRMWMAAPFSWTVGLLSPITLLANTQDYTIIKPADFLYLQSAYLYDGTSLKEELEIVANLPADVKVGGNPAQICLVPGTSTIRVSPKPKTLSGSTQYIVMTYKKTYTPITAGNLTNTVVLGFPDEWYHVYEDGVLWRAMIYADDQRAGGAQAASNGSVAYSGQCGVFYAGLQEMIQAEKMPVKWPGQRVEKG